MNLCPFCSSGPVSARLLVNLETVAVGMTLALLVFPLQCLLGFRLRKSRNKVEQRKFNVIYVLTSVLLLLVCQTAPSINHIAYLS